MQCLTVCVFILYSHTTSWGKYIALYTGTKVKVHMIVAMKYSSSNHLSLVCLVVHCNISGSSVLCCNKTAEFI